jgi:hypothetical protein
VDSLAWRWLKICAIVASPSPWSRRPTR